MATTPVRRRVTDDQQTPQPYAEQMVPPSSPSVTEGRLDQLLDREIRAGLIELRKREGLAQPMKLATDLSRPVQEYLLGEKLNGDELSTAQAKRLHAVLMRAIDALDARERQIVRVELNLDEDYYHSQLTDRQQHLARDLQCGLRAVRRRSAQSLGSLTYHLQRGAQADAATRQNHQADQRHSLPPRWHDEMRTFWHLSDTARVDIVCSEIPEDERPQYAFSGDRNYLRYAKFADLDTLIYLRTRFAQLASGTLVRDFAPSEYFDTQADVVAVVGGPPWNAKYRELLARLPYYFEPHDLGEDDPLVFPSLNNLTLGPRWSVNGDLLEDLVVLTRLTLAQGTRVFLFGGCLTLGVLGSAHCLLEGERGARSLRFITSCVGEADFVLVTEVHRVGGLVDVADLSQVPPLLLLSREHNEPFATIIDNSDRYLSGIAAGHRSEQ